MSDHTTDGLTEEELEQVSGAPLPDREAMSILPLPGEVGFYPPGELVTPDSEPGGGHTLPVEPPAEQ